MNQLSSPGIVLRRTNYQEADRILTVLSRDYSKVSIIAKGVRKSKSKLAGGIELFAVNDLTFIKGKSNLHTLTSSRVSSQFGNIVKDIDRTMKAYDFIKLVDKIVDDQAEHNDYFELLAVGLEGMNNLQLDHNLTSIWFYLHALAISGVLPNLRTDIEGNMLDQDQSYDFSVADMQFVKSDNGIFNTPHIKLLRVALKHGSTKKLSNINVDPAITTTCSNVLRKMVEHNLL